MLGVLHREQIAGAVVLIGVVRIRRELVPGVHHAAVCCSVAHRIVGKTLRCAKQRMAGVRQPIQLIVSEGLWPSSIGQSGPIPDVVIDIVGLIDLRGTGRELVEDVRDLIRGIIIASA